jgi:type I restriction enzyme S subunit
MERYYEGGAIPWVKSGELREGLIVETEEHVTDAALRETSVKLVPAGAILIAMYGATVGRLAILGVEATTNQAVCHIVPDAKAADTSYLYRAIAAQVPAIVAMGVGGAQPNIGQALVKDLQVPLPPLPEQRRIAAILDQADALGAKRREALAQLDSLTQSIFIEMFGDSTVNPMAWPQPCLGELMESGPQNGLYKPSTDYGSGTPILRIDAFYDGAVTKLTTLKRVRVTADEVRVFGLAAEDVVINRVNSIEYLGKCALIPALQEPTVFESNMMRFKVASERVLPTYLVAFLQVPFIKEQIRAASKDSVNQSSINQQDVKAFKTNVPPLALQKTFATRIQAVEALKATHRAALAELNALFASLQHRAFAGQL